MEGLASVLGKWGNFYTVLLLTGNFQCVSFSLIDVGSGFTAYVVFSSFTFYSLPGELNNNWGSSL